VARVKDLDANTVFPGLVSFHAAAVIVADHEIAGLGLLRVHKGPEVPALGLGGRGGLPSDSPGRQSEPWSKTNEPQGTDPGRISYLGDAHSLPGRGEKDKRLQIICKLFIINYLD